MNNPLLEIERLVVQHGWADIAEKTISRECIEVETGGDVWHLPYSIYKNTTINFSKIENIGLRWCVKRYIQDRLQSLRLLTFSFLIPPLLPFLYCPLKFFALFLLSADDQSTFQYD